MEDCYYFYTADCKRADTCRYRHIVRALDNAQLCKYYSTGTCTNLRCKFKHNYFDDVGSVSNNGKRFVNASIEPHSVDQNEKKQELCIYHFHGRCKLGESCKFIHNDSELHKFSKSSIVPTLDQAAAFPSSCSSASGLEGRGKHHLENTVESVPKKALKSDKAKSILSRYSNSTLVTQAKQGQEEEEEEEEEYEEGASNGAIQ